MTAFPIIPSKTALLFFDTLNIYLHPEDEAARRAIQQSGIIERLRRINAACRDVDIPVFYAQADHRPDGRDFAPQIVDRGHSDEPGGPRLTQPAGVTSGNAAAEVIPEIAPQPGDYIIKKHRWSAFYQTHLELSLRTAGIDTILLAGGSTEVGIASTAYSARDLDFHLIVLKDACRSARQGVDDFFASRIFPIFARIMTVDEAIAGIGSQ